MVDSDGSAATSNQFIIYGGHKPLAIIHDHWADFIGSFLLKEHVTYDETMKLV